MRKWLAVLLCTAVVSNAQEGYPLDGTWRGELADGSHTTIVLIMQWDGSRIAGTINPGPTQVEFTSATLDPQGWKFSLAAKGAANADISFSGELAELGKYNRTLTGKWMQGSKTHDIRFVRE